MGEDGGSDVVERDERERIVTFFTLAPPCKQALVGGLP